MPKEQKSSGAATAEKDGPSFETALKNLEEIVTAMEEGELPLEQLLARFEAGTKLVKICQGKLQEAELKIQKLEKNATGEMNLEPVKLSNLENEL